jgi:hypothetical protein
MSELSEADEMKIIDFETYKFRRRMDKRNKEFKHVKVLEVKVRVNHPVPVKMVKHWWQFWK